MKTKLLYFILAVCAYSFSQSISTFNSIDDTNFTVAESTTTIDQSPTGMNVTWTFSNLIPTATNIDTYTMPTAMEVTTYPGTTEVLTIITQGMMPVESKLFLNENISTSEIAITGAEQGDIQLNYSGDNALIGAFPMVLGTTNTDNVSGTFTYQGASGTFTGTATPNADAFGALNITDSNGQSYTGTVTRLRLDQNLSFSIPPIFNNIGTLTQTTYYYYDNATNNVVFRYNLINLVSGFLGVNETTETLEYDMARVLSTNDAELSSNLTFYPNPVEDILTFEVSNNTLIETLQITDISGKEILNLKTVVANQISLQHLNAGMYFLNINTNKGLVTKKILKN